MQTLFDRHPLPWTCDEKSTFDSYFVKDAKGGTVVLVGTMDETSQERADADAGVTRIIIKRPKPGVLRLVRMIVALPDLLKAVTDAHAALSGTPHARDVLVAERLETLIEKLA